MEKLNDQLRDRDISPQKFARIPMGRDSILDKSPILVQQYHEKNTSNRFTVDKQSQGSNLTRLTSGIYRQDSYDTGSAIDNDTGNLGQI